MSVQIPSSVDVLIVPGLDPRLGVLGQLIGLLAAVAPDDSRYALKVAWFEDPEASIYQTTPRRPHSFERTTAMNKLINASRAIWATRAGAWSWMYVRNYPSRGLSGLQGGSNGPKWTGDQAYRLEFLTRSNVSATVIIYDR